MRTKDIDELSTEMVEWINGERISLEEYEARISAHINVLAGSHLLKTNSDLNWIFGLS